MQQQTGMTMRLDLAHRQRSRREDAEHAWRNDWLPVFTGFDACSVQQARRFRRWGYAMVDDARYVSVDIELAQWIVRKRRGGHDVVSMGHGAVSLCWYLRQTGRPLAHMTSLEMMQKTENDLGQPQTPRRAQ
jgi:hypothetical protein